MKPVSDIEKYKKQLIRDFHKNDKFSLGTRSVSILLQPFEMVYKGKKQVFQMEIMLKQLTNDE